MQCLRYSWIEAKISSSMSTFEQIVATFVKPNLRTVWTFLFKVFENTSSKMSTFLLWNLNFLLVRFFLYLSVFVIRLSSKCHVIGRSSDCHLRLSSHTVITDCHHRLSSQTSSQTACRLSSQTVDCHHKLSSQTVIKDWYHRMSSVITDCHQSAITDCQNSWDPKLGT